MMDEGMRLGPGSAARAGLAAALVLFLCWQHVQATRLGYRVEAARKQARERGSRVAALRVELEQRLSPAEVSLRASRMGLIPAGPDALRRLPDRGMAGSSKLRQVWARKIAPIVAAARS